MITAGMQICIDEILSDDVQLLLDAHLQAMHANTPPGSVHALDSRALGDASVTFWTVRENGLLLGCGALKELSASEGELKSMRTAADHVRRGVATLLLNRIQDQAVVRGYRHLYLETGSGPEFQAARTLYTRRGFRLCPPFHDYREDPNSAYMRLDLGLPDASDAA